MPYCLSWQRPLGLQSCANCRTTRGTGPAVVISWGAVQGAWDEDEVACVAALQCILSPIYAGGRHGFSLVCLPYPWRGGDCGSIYWVVVIALVAVLYEPAPRTPS